MLLNSARCLRTLQNVTAGPGTIGQIARAALVLVLFVDERLT
jgi:hypothetical protein